MLAAHTTKRFADRDAWTAHLQALGITALDVHPDPVPRSSQTRPRPTIPTARSGLRLVDGEPEVTPDTTVAWPVGIRSPPSLDASDQLALWHPGLTAPMLVAQMPVAAAALPGYQVYVRS